VEELHVGKSKYRLVRIVDENFTQDIGGHRHGVQSYEIHYCTRGSGELSTESNSYPLSQGTLYVTGPNVWHRQLVDKKNPLGEICVFVELITKGSDILSASFNSTHFWIGRASSAIKEIFELLYGLLDKNSVYSREMRTHLSELIITELSHLYSKNFVAAAKDTPDDKKLVIIDESFIYDYSNITINELADRIGLSVRQTQRVLKQFYGVTFREKCMKSRLEAAYIMLKNGKSVSQVATDVGYADTPAFIRAFKNMYKKTPAQVIKEKQ